MPRTLASHRLLLAGGATAVALVALAVALLLVGAPLDYVSWPGLLRNGRIGRLNVPSSPSPLPALAQARSGLRAGQTAGVSLSLSSLGSDLGLGQATTPAAPVSPPGLGLAPAPLTVAPPSDPSVVGLTTPGVGLGPSGVGVLGPLPARPGLQPPVGSPPVPAPPGPVLTPVSAAPAPASSAPASPGPSPSTPALPIPAPPVSTPLPASRPASAPDPLESRTMDSGLRPGSSGARPGSSGGGDGRGSHRVDAGKGAKPPRDAPEVVHGHGRDAGPPPPPPQDQDGPGGPAPAPTPEPRGPDLHPHGASGPSRPPGRSPDAPWIRPDPLATALAAVAVDTGRGGPSRRRRGGATRSDQVARLG